MKVDKSELPNDKLALIDSFTALDESELQASYYSNRLHQLPAEYIDFLREYGYGKVRERGEPQNFPAHFEILRYPLSAEKDYYQDTRIYENGAKGDVLIIGLESTGIAYGFDIGEGSALVQIDNYRLVRKLNMSFCEFFFGLLACYPDLPEKYVDGYWFNDIDERYSLSGY